MKHLVSYIFATSLLLTFSAVSQALIYKYVDDADRTVFVDDIEKVPRQFRYQLELIPEAGDTLSPELFDSLEDQQVQSDRGFKIKPQLQENPAREEKLRFYRTPIVIQDNRVMVPVEVAMGNRIAHLLLLLDTGASSTALHRQSLSKLELPTGEKVDARIAGGQVLLSEKIRFKHIEVGPFREKNIHAMVIDLHGQPLPFDGMLGMDFLKNHPYRIDYYNEVLFWEIP